MSAVAELDNATLRIEPALGRPILEGPESDKQLPAAYGYLARSEK